MTTHPETPKKAIARGHGQTRLVMIWLPWSLILLLIVIVQGARSVYGPKGNEAISWLLPNIMPTLLLTVSVWARDATAQKARSATNWIAKSIFWITLLISVSYLVFVSLAIILAQISELPPIDFLKQMNLVLGPFQGIVAAALGIFFAQCTQ